MLTSPGWRGPNSQWHVLLFFSFALVLGGATTASVLAVASGFASAAAEVVRHSLLVCLSILFSIREIGLLSFKLPQRAKLIPQSVFARPFPANVVQFGWELGTGVRTYISSTTPYLVGAILLLGKPDIAALLAAGVGFGVGRAASPISRFASGDGDRWDDLLDRRLGVVTRAAFVATLLLGLGLFLQREIR
ncbi:MAG TPA: hypothetical protein VHN37_11050 [Actinomycetota bacterium]|nr:hypothetical protein [Actinomycetota bacterium]